MIQYLQKLNETKLLPESRWYNHLQPVLDSPEFLKFWDWLMNEYKNGDRPIYPEPFDIFKAFYKTSFDLVRVVIVGQDPYHGPGQANGLCFGVNPGGVKTPSLRNILRELEFDLGVENPDCYGTLDGWAEQGVLLLNSILTVQHSTPGSHAKKGWELLTDQAIRELSVHRRGLVFMLWGKKAQEKRNVIQQQDQHLIIESGHPSPHNVKNFFNTKPFSRANDYITAQARFEKVDWLSIDKLIDYKDLSVRF